MVLRATFAVDGELDPLVEKEANTFMLERDVTMVFALSGKDGPWRGFGTKTMTWPPLGAERIQPLDSLSGFLQHFEVNAQTAYSHPFRDRELTAVGRAKMLGKTQRV